MAYIKDLGLQELRIIYLSGMLLSSYININRLQFFLHKAKTAPDVLVEPSAINSDFR